MLLCVVPLPVFWFVAVAFEIAAKPVEDVTGLDVPVGLILATPEPPPIVTSVRSYNCVV